MTGNTCPSCGKPVMAYIRFLRQMEPRKTISCGSCGTRIRLRTGVYAILVAMYLFLGVISVVPTMMMMNARVRVAVFLPAALVWACLWAVVTNFLSWRFIPWVPADEPETEAESG
jgi:hypothetical protein